MSPEDRAAITTSIANLWSFQTSFMVQITRTLQETGAVSHSALEQMLQRCDRDSDILEGEDDKAFAMGALATVRRLLVEWRDAPKSGPASP